MSDDSLGSRFRHDPARFVVRASTSTDVLQALEGIPVALVEPEPVRLGPGWADWRMCVSVEKGHVEARRDEVMAAVRRAEPVVFSFHEYHGDAASGLLLEQLIVQGSPRARRAVEAMGCTIAREVGRTWVCATTSSCSINALKVSDRLRAEGVRARPLLARARPRRQEGPWELSSDPWTAMSVLDAHATTRGLGDVRIAVIDTAFDLQRLDHAAVEFHDVLGRTSPAGPASAHGTIVAELIVGDGGGYAGVCPDATLVVITMPTYTTEAEEARAFDLAREAGAGVVCCPWGPPFEGGDTPRPIPLLTAAAIDSLHQYGRQGRGSVVMFAVGSDDADVALDGYASHRSVTAVAGITRGGERPPSMDRGEAVALAAPASVPGAAIGGTMSVPPGASGSVGLAAGVAGLVLSANPELSGTQVIEALTETATLPPGTDGPSEYFGHGVVDAAAAVSAASSMVPRPPHEHWNVPTQTTTSDPTRRRREQRFEGGEHSSLGMWALRAVRSRLGSHDVDFNSTFFGPDLGFHVPEIDVDFRAPVDAILRDLVGVSHRPLLSSDLPFHRLILDFYGVPVGAFVGMAADLHGSPPKLFEDLQDGFHRPSRIWQCFLDEIEGSFLSSYADEHLTFVQLGNPNTAFVKLAEKNYSHFAGDNLLFYLSYHLAALGSAKEAGVRSAGDEPLARRFFVDAIIRESFAIHFLTDMFSSGHARVPRWALLHDVFEGDEGRAHLLAKLMHDHDGRLGVPMRNAHGDHWVAFGDSHLLTDSPLLDAQGTPRSVSFPGQEQLTWSGDSPMPPTPNDFESTAAGLATSLAYVSWLDVFRHMADVGAVLSTDAALGASPLGYVLDRVPYALPQSELASAAGLRATLADIYPPEVFEQAVERVGMEDRYSEENVGLLLETYRDINFLIRRYVKKVVTVTSPRQYQRHLMISTETEDDFKQWIWEEYLQVPTMKQWAGIQANNLGEHLIGPDALSSVPWLLFGGSFLPATALGLVANDLPDILSRPSGLKDLLPPALVSALTSITGSWGFENE